MHRGPPAPERIAPWPPTSLQKGKQKHCHGRREPLEASPKEAEKLAGEGAAPQEEPQPAAMAPGVVAVEEEGEQQQQGAPPRRSPLAVEALRDKIVEKVKANRVTLIIGDTGCGKSSLGPQFLLEENMEPILCTQPRRFAVVAIARAIAESRNWQLGEEVGYHIGHSNVSDLNSKRSKIVFKTAGVVLEQMCDRGIAALRYKVIILDEVHERSVESDLVLASIRQFLMKKSDLRLVLMSATADITRYKEYFRDVGRGERVEVIAIPSSPRTSIFQRKVLYLEQIADILKINSPSLSTTYCSGLDASADAEITSDVYELIHKCIFFIGVLTDEALQTMKISKSCRKVILATNIAESSVTIPGVAYVIDSCRSLQVYWDPIRKTDAAGLVWISKSQAEQRKGRTGRTCDGQIYRLVTGTFYSSLNDHEYPAILRLSLREQVLMVKDETFTLFFPPALLQKVLNPPDPDAVEDALESLVQIHALEKTSSGRYQPTFYGCLLNSLPLSFDSSVLTLKFCELGAVHEGILISIMLDIQPLPILQPFGYQVLCQKYRDNYFKENGSVQIGKKEATTIGNLCAFQFWERVFKDKHRLDYLKDVANDQEPEESHTFLAKPEEEWCAIHNLVPAAFKNISEIYDGVMKQLHHFRPSFLVKINPPKYLQPSKFSHTCLHNEILELEEDMDSLSLEAENSHCDSQNQCAATPNVLQTDFGTTTIVEMLKMLVKEMKTQHVEEKTVSYMGQLGPFVKPTLGAEACVFFVNGSCTQGDAGDACRFSHSSFAPKPVCKFFLTLQGCRNGNSCPYSHDTGSLISTPSTSGICCQEGRATSLCCTRLFPADGDGHILILNDKTPQFSSKLSQYYDACKIVAGTPGLQSVESYSVPKGLKILQNLADPSSLITGRDQKLPVPWTKLKRVFWFADFDNDESAGEQALLQKFFENIAIKILSERLSGLQVILIMKNTRYIQLQVKRLARECFFFLSESFLFDEATLGWFS
ncbi:zinc finger CCCH domain-containing protein 4 isoform X1 [Panicum miliaceum]|uniref:Zinc finger CCCH domain-containing protein 4 isoform X1 n=1 Tax=Panicum miliaceum TaxID=4540 RepID=A0A3L6QZ73_PANMI|nr:zinc finger CCCH domain-containing protein 4 isoform X1 [Panicum miliaceum]